VIEVLEPLGSVPGVRIAVLVTRDGVPVVVRGKRPLDDEQNDLAPDEESAQSLSGLAAGWLQGLASSIAPLSWEAPRRVILRAARGTLVSLQAPGAILIVLIEPGASPEQLRLPMEGAVARLQRILRGTKSARSEAAATEGALPEGALPVRALVKGPDLVPADSPRKHSPREFPG